MLTLFRLLRASTHSVLLFVLPWIIGALVGTSFDIDEVTETSRRFTSIFAMVVLPLLVLQVIAIGVKVGRELRAERARGRRGFEVLAFALDRHVRVLTSRGLGMVLASLAMVGMALIAKWGQFGVIAVAGLGILYLASTAACLVSAFSVRADDDRVRRGRGSIEREMSQAVIEAGDAVDERFALANVPVPPGFRLHIEEALPRRLAGETRFALDRSVSRARITVAAPLPRTPRGVYRLGPASIWYEDILGLTRVYVAARAHASLRALPRVRPLVFERQPRSRARAEGTQSVLARIATEEHFRTRAYVPGDDLRRVHWKQSVNTGNLIVRLPESVPYAPTRVRLVLDTYLPPKFRIAPDTGGVKVTVEDRGKVRVPDAVEELLDLLVETWVSLAHALQARGEAVTLVTVARDDAGHPTIRELEGKRGEERRWRSLGADVAWQSDVPVEVVSASLGHAAAGGKAPSTIVVSAGLWFGAPASPGSTVVVADGASLVPDVPPDPRSPLTQLLFYDYPAGADENRLDLRRLMAPRPIAPALVRQRLAEATGFAVAHARASSVPVLVVKRQGLALALVTP